MRQARVIKGSAPPVSPENTVAYLRAEKEREELEMKEKAQSEKDAEKEKIARIMSNETDIWPPQKPKSLTEALRLMQEQWKAIGVGFGSAYAQKQKTASAMSLSLSSWWSSPAPAVPLAVAAAVPAVPLTPLTQRLDRAGDAWSVAARVLKRHRGALLLCLGLCALAWGSQALASSSTAHIPPLPQPLSKTSRVADTTMMAQKKKKKSESGAAQQEEDEEEEPFDEKDFQRYLERETRRKASITRREVDEMQDPGAMSFYDVVEESHIAGELRPIKRKLLRRRRQWRVENDPSLPSERADLLFDDSRDNEPDVYSEEDLAEEEEQEEQEEEEESAKPHDLAMELDREAPPAPAPAPRPSAPTAVVSVIDAPADSRVSLSPAAPPAAPQKSLWSKLSSSLFSRSPAGRPVDLQRALSLSPAEALASDAEREAQRDFKARVAGALTAALPVSVRESVPELLLCEDKEKEATEDALSLSLSQNMQRGGLSLSNAAEGFADVANAFAVRLVDRAVSLAEQRGAERERETRVLAALDELAAFVERVERVFVSLFPAESVAHVAPIVYNGLAKRTKIETLFDTFLRARSLSGAAALPMDAFAAQGDAFTRAERVDRLQSLLGVSEERRLVLQQKQQRESMWALAKSVVGGAATAAGEKRGGATGSVLSALGTALGGGQNPAQAAMPGLQQLLGGGGGAGLPLPDMAAMQQISGGKGMFDFKDLEKMFPGAGQGGIPDFNELQKMMGGQGSMPDMAALHQMLGGQGGGPDMDAMQKLLQQSGLGDESLQNDPQRMRDLAAESFRSLSSAVEQNALRKEDVENFESMLGIDVDDLLSALTQQRVDVSKLKDTLGADENETRELFLKLSKIKRGL